VFDKTLRPLLIIACTVLLAGCASGPPPAKVPTGHGPTVVDQRAAPLAVAKEVESGGVRLYLGEEVFGPGLIEILHRELALGAPRSPNPRTVAVSDIEVSVLVRRDDLLIDSTRAGSYVPKPGVLILADLRPEAEPSIQTRIRYAIDGRTFEEHQTGVAPAPDVRVRASELYDKAIDGLITRLSESG
jgi:hypothetical protein